MSKTLLRSNVHIGLIQHDAANAESNLYFVKLDLLSTQDYQNCCLILLSTSHFYVTKSSLRSNSVDFTIGSFPPSPFPLSASSSLEWSTIVRRENPPFENMCWQEDPAPVIWVCGHRTNEPPQSRIIWCPAADKRGSPCPNPTKTSKASSHNRQSKCRSCRT